jgi:uncharacterized protein
MKPRILSIILTVGDLKKSLAFYRDGLGLPTRGIVATSEEPGDSGQIVLFDMGNGQTLSLYTRADLAKAGGSIDPAHDRGGVYSGYFQDLDGHLWEILCPLG